MMRNILITDNATISSYQEPSNKILMDEFKFIFLSGLLFPDIFQPDTVDLGTFVHYNLVDILGIPEDGEQYESIRNRTFAHLTKLMTIEDHNLNLLLLVKLMTINNFNYNLDTFPEVESSQQLNSIHINPCLNTMKKVYSEFENSVDSDDSMTEIPLYSGKSPCMDLNNHQECHEFSKWFDNLIKTLPKMEMLTLMRYALPQPGVRVKAIEETERKIAGMLFGEENLKNELMNLKAPNPLMIYCKNRKDQGFTGDVVEGFSGKFCNNFYPSPTDIGMCLTQNIDLKQSIEIEHDYSKFMQTDHQNASSLMNGGNRNEESTFVLLTDIFENVNLYDVR